MSSSAARRPSSVSAPRAALDPVDRVVAGQRVVAAPPRRFSKPPIVSASLSVFVARLAVTAAVREAKLSLSVPAPPVSVSAPPAPSKGLRVAVAGQRVGAGRADQRLDVVVDVVVLGCRGALPTVVGQVVERHRDCGGRRAFEVADRVEARSADEVVGADPQADLDRVVVRAGVDGDRLGGVAGDRLAGGEEGGELDRVIAGARRDAVGGGPAGTRAVAEIDRARRRRAAGVGDRVDELVVAARQVDVEGPRHARGAKAAVVAGCAAGDRRAARARGHAADAPHPAVGDAAAGRRDLDVVVGADAVDDLDIAFPTVTHVTERGSTRPPMNDEGPGVDPGPFANLSLETPCRYVAQSAAGGTSPGTDEAGVSVWIPLAYPAAGRLAAGHLQGPARTVTQLRTTPFLWSAPEYRTRMATRALSLPPLGGGSVSSPASSATCRRSLLDVGVRRRAVDLELGTPSPDLGDGGRVTAVGEVAGAPRGGHRRAAAPRPRTRRPAPRRTAVVLAQVHHAHALRGAALAVDPAHAGAQRRSRLGDEHELLVLSHDQRRRPASPLCSVGLDRLDALGAARWSGGTRRSRSACRSRSR